MSHVDADLREVFELHRSRILQLRRNCLARLFEIVEISPDTTDREELELVWDEEWPYNVSLSHLPASIKSGHDFYSLVTNGTKPPLPEGERLSIFAEIEALLRERATGLSDPQPLTLPEDFKQLCTLTDSLEGPGIGMTGSGLPHAFDGLKMPLRSLRFSSESASEAKYGLGLWYEDYRPTVSLFMGAVSCVPGGTWLCWFKDDDDVWGWKWVTRVCRDGEAHVYEDVRELLDQYWKQYLNVVLAKYDDIGQDALL
ncbi:hypothetical protein KCU64_g844, partial [Aureobasidium melanogenum]